jgi:hypothetical protein
VICQFGVMFFPEKDKAYREAFRVLSPGGRYVFNIWDSFDHNPFGRLAHETIGGFFADDKPTFYLTPFGYAPIDPIKASFMAAGFRDIVISVLSHTKIVRNTRLFAGGACARQPHLRRDREPRDGVRGNDRSDHGGGAEKVIRSRATQSADADHSVRGAEAWRGRAPRDLTSSARLPHFPLPSAGRGWGAGASCPQPRIERANSRGATHGTG